MTIDPDVEVLLRGAIRESGAPFKQVLNNAIREGLRPKGRRAKEADEPFRQRTFDMGRPLVDLSKANALADELGDAALIEKLRVLG